VNIDEQKNIYMQTLDGIRKFSADGTLLWTYLPAWRENGEEMPDSASIYHPSGWSHGAVYVSTTHGHVVAVNMADGTEIWKTKLSSTDGNNGWVSVSEGTVILGSNAYSLWKGIPLPDKMADQNVTGLNATDGTVIWNYQPEAPVWNFMGSFAGDGTFTFQDYEGRAYRNRVSDGTNIWKSGGVNFSWTDGSSMIGPALSEEESLQACNRTQCKVVYTVSNRDMFGGRDAPGDVSAYRLEDGQLLWRAEVPRPPNNMPAVGRLHGKTGLSLVQPIGQQCHQGNPTDVYALDALTGELQWIFNGPSQASSLQAGDKITEAQHQRELSGVRKITLPNPWSAPTVDSNGVVFIGNQEGGFFSLVDANGDGKVTGDEEVSLFNTSACFSGSSAAGIAPGILVATSIDAMYVFKV
jgi:outer membrane protein assembly factor BamB